MSPCVEWTGPLTKAGYGENGSRADRRKYGTRYVHRQAWIEANGPIPTGMFVCHKCDNPPCYNLEHLFIGTQSDNMADMVAKGRGGPPTGQAHPNTKLTWDAVRDIRARYVRGNKWREGNAKELGQEYGITHDYVYLIANNKRWVETT